jgi:membrane associated rhomboid family serine protease
LEPGLPASVTPAAPSPAPPPGAPARLAPPWDAPDIFPPKPGDSDYGWRSRGRSHPCTREELIERCRSSAGGRQFVELVWTPDTPRMVPPAEVSWLVEPLRQRARADLRYNLRIDAGVLALGILYIVYMQTRRPPADVPPLYLAVFLLFAIVPAAQDVWALSRLRRSFAYLAEQAEALRYAVWLGARRIVATYFVGGALLAVWAAQLVVGLRESFAAAGLDKPLVRHNGEWWRLLTAELLHGHWFHIGLNLLSLLAVGRLVEVHGSPVYLPTVFLFSAVSASLASLLLQPATTSVGASGAIMGLVGFLAVMGYRRRHALPRGFMKSISLSIALTAGAGLVAHDVVDNAAHFGGLLGGALLGFVYAGRRGEAHRLAPSVTARVAGWMSALLLGLATAITIWFVLQSRLRGLLG